MTMIIGISLGDPAGIGPEIIARCFAELSTQPTSAVPVVVGPAWAIEPAREQYFPSARMRMLRDLHQHRFEPGVIPYLNIDEPCTNEFVMGRVSAVAGRAAVRAVEATCKLALAGQIGAMVTAPINKESVHAAGYVDDIGHQEILARLTQTPLTATLLMTPGLRVAHLSTHKSLANAVAYVRQEHVVSKAKLTHESLLAWGVGKPRIAIAALNPHGSEGGLLGDEEQRELVPAVATLQTMGVDAVGPIPADSVFIRAIAGEFDAVLALYHDQGHIAIKVHNFHDSVTVTMGIPFVRTSVDHGTAFDIAGRGVADHRSLMRAIEMADTLVHKRLTSLRRPVRQH